MSRGRYRSAYLDRRPRSRVATAVIAAGCGGGGGIESSGSGPAGQVDASGPVQGKLTISQWPLYIDPGKNGTIAEFEGKTGVDVNYIEDINDNNQFFGKLQPQLAKGQSGGRGPDHPQRLAGEADVRLRVPPEARLLEAAERQAEPDPVPAPSDRGPESRFHGPLAERDDGADRQHRAGAGRELDLRSVRPEVQGQGRHADRAARHGPDDPEVHGHRSRTRPRRPSGSPPSTRSRSAADSGQIRRFTGNDYIRDLSSGDVDFVLGWSGDAIQMQKDNPNIKFVMPKEGCMLWSTSMEIPVGAPNPAAAEAWMNYVYDPKVQADIAEYVNYVTPVKGVKQILAKRDPQLAKSQLIFPSARRTRKNCTFEPVLGGEQGHEVTQAFNAVING